MKLKNNPGYIVVIALLAYCRLGLHGRYASFSSSQTALTPWDGGTHSLEPRIFHRVSGTSLESGALLWHEQLQRDRIGD